MVDPSPHLGLVWRVIHSMDIPSHYRDEAFSEGLVALTVAAKRFDPSRTVPLANWLGMSLRWSLGRWRRKEAQRQHLSLEEIRPVHHDSPDHRLRLEETLKASETLTDAEFIALFGPAIGMKQCELSHELSMAGVGIAKAREQARQKVCSQLGEPLWQNTHRRRGNRDGCYPLR